MNNRKTAIIIISILTLAVAGTISYVFYLTRPLKILKNYTIPTEFEYNNQKIALAWTDDNTGENLIIQSDRKEYNGFSSVDVYFSITNINKRDQNMDVVVWVENERVRVEDMERIALTAPSAGAALGAVRADQLGRERGFETKSINGFTTGYSANDQIESGQTNYYKATIKYPPMSKGEFFIEAIGTSPPSPLSLIRRGGDAEGGGGEVFAYGHLDPWYSSDWTYRKHIIIDADQVLANETDFPVLATTTDASLAFTDSGGKVASSTGADIVFADTEGNLLNYEREKYDSATGEIAYWVKTDISSTTDTVLYMYYGNSTMSADLATTTGVWDDNFVMVNHLASDGVATTTYPDFLDSTKYNNDGSSVNMNSDDLVDGQVDGSLDFDGVDDRIEIANSASFATINSSYTISLITKLDVANGVGFTSKYANGEGYSFIVDYDGVGQALGIKHYEGWSTSQAFVDWRPGIGIWYHLVVAFNPDDANEATFYASSLGGAFGDGANGLTANMDKDVNVNSGVFEIGHISSVWSGRYTDGLIDEVRISNVARTAGWIATEYNNQSDVASFLTIGGEEDNTPTEFISSIMQSGGDYNKLSTWENAVECDLTATTTRVYSGTGTGLLSEDDTVELFRNTVYQNITATVVATTSDQILVDNITGANYDLVAQSGDQWRLASSTDNMWTIIGTTGNELGDTAIAIAKIDGAWTEADTTAVTINGWTTSAINYIKIYTTESARHNGVWDDTKYRLSSGSSSYEINIDENYTKIHGLQINASLYNSGEIVDGTSTTGEEIAYCIIKSNDDSSSLRGITNVAYVYNNIVYCGVLSTTLDGIDGFTYAYNNTIYDCDDGIAGSGVAKNNIVQNCNNGFSGTFNSNSTHNISDDDTAPAYGVYYRNTTVSFADSANDDFHLAGNDANARNAGVDLSGDANLAFTDDIDGETRGARGWDIGADETGASVMINSTITNKLTDGLVGHWTFNGPDMDWASTTAEALDRSGEANNGNVIGAKAAIGVSGQGMEFDGADDYVDAGDVYNGVKTLAFWIKADSTTEDIIDLDGGTHTASSTSGTITANGFASPAVYVDGSVGSTITTEWHYIVFTTETAINANDMDIGKIGSSFFDGILDEVRIYNRALSAEEIAEQYRAGARTMQTNSPITNYLTDGLAGQWTFNGPDMDWASSTAEALDRSGNSNNGNVIGATPAIGKVGQGLSFDGVDDYVDVPDANSLDATSVTLSAWVKSDTAGRYIVAKDPPEVTRNKIQDTRYKQITNSKSQITNKSQIPNSKFYNYKDVSSSAAPQSLAEDCGGNSQTVWQKAIDFVKDSGRKALARSMRWLHCSRRSGTVEPECKTLKNNNGLQNGSTALRDYGADSEVGGGFSGADRAEKVSYNTDVVNLEDGKKKYQIHVGHINYKDDETNELEKIDTTLLPSAYGWEMDKASYHLEIPEYADDWFKFVNDFEEFDNQKTTPEKEMALGGPENIISSGSTSQQDADNNIVADENENYKNVFYQECGAESNQKTISNEMAPGSLTDLPICAPDKLINSIAYQNNLSSVSYMDVEIGGIEPPKRSLSDTRGKPAIHTSNLLYQKNFNQEIAAIFAPTQSPKRDCGGHASKPPQSSARDCGEAGCETVAMRPIGVSHTKGELIENDEWNKKKVLYKNAFGNNIDLEVAAKNIGFDKLVVINEKPKDLSQDLEFSFEIGLDGFEVYTSPPAPLLNRRGEIGEEDGLEEWNQEEPLETSQRIILNKLKQTWFREFSVWDSAGNRGKIRVRIEKVDDDNQKTTPEKEMASGASAGASTELVNYNCSIADENNLSSIYKYCGLQASNASHMDVDMPGIEPGKHELTSSASQPAITTSNLLYQNKNHGTNNYKYIFTKILDKEFLENAVYPVWTDDTTSYYAGAGDGYITRGVYNAGESWDTIHDSLSGDSNDDTGVVVNITSGDYSIINYDYLIQRAFIPINTSDIDDAATITDATLYLYITEKTDTDNDGNDWINIVQTTQASTASLENDDYDQCGSIDNPTEGATRIDIGDITTSAYNAWALDAIGIGWIDKTGWTKLGAREGHDCIDSVIITTASFNGISFSASEDATGDGDDQDPYLEVTTAPKSDVPYALSTVGGGQFLIMNSGTTYTATSTTDINDSQWHHIVGSYDGTTMKIYIDGTLEDTNTDFSGNLPTNDGNVRIGADYQSTPDNFFSGLIDEARIYNRALSADEVGELYRVGARRFQAN